MPLAEYCAPETITLETITSELPAFVSMTLKALLFPRATFPKLKLEVLVVRRDVAAIPVPLKDTVLGELEMSLMTETLPDKAPAVFGAKITLNVDCFPASIVKGSEIPVIVTPGAVVLACVTLRFDPPPFVIVTDCEAVLPRATAPKLTDAGSTVIVAAPGVLCWPDATLGAPVSPMQPELDRMAKSRRPRAATEIARLTAELALVERASAHSNRSFIGMHFIKVIVVRDKRGDY
jgi:hypothetical protein